MHPKSSDPKYTVPSVFLLKANVPFLILFVVLIFQVLQTGESQERRQSCV